MARFVNYDMINQVVELLQEVYYDTEKADKLAFKYIEVEQVSLRVWEDRYPEDSPTEPKCVIEDSGVDDRVYKKLKVVVCIEETMKTYGLKMSSKDIQKTKSLDLSTAVLTYGKYKGRTVKSVAKDNPDYIKWLIKETSLPSHLEEVCKHWLGNSDIF